MTPSHKRWMLRSYLLCLFLGIHSACNRDADESNRVMDLLRSNEKKTAALEQKIGELELGLAQTQGVLAMIHSQSSPIVPASYPSDSSDKDDPFIGNKNSPVIVVHFSDYQCSPCRDFVKDTLPLMRREFIDTNKVLFIFRDYPLSANQHSLEAATLAQCAGELGGYWKMFEALFSQRASLDQGDLDSIIATVPELAPEKLDKCLKSSRSQKEVRLDVLDAEQIGAKGAPGTFVGRKDEQGNYQGVFIRGAQPYPVFRKYIATALANAAQEEKKQ